MMLLRITARSAADIADRSFVWIFAIGALSPLIADKQSSNLPVEIDAMGHSQPIHSAPMPTNVWSCFISDRFCCDAANDAKCHEPTWS